MSENTIPNQNKSVIPGAGGPPASIRDRLLARASEKPSLNIRDYLIVFFKHKKTIFISFISIAILASLFLYLFFAPRFQARSLVMVKFGWENYSPDLLAEGSGDRRLPAVNQAEIVQSEVRILQSRELKERVVNSLSPEVVASLVPTPIPGLTSAEAAIVYMERNLRTTAGKGNTIEVTFTADSAGSAAAVVNQLVGAYIERRNEIYKDPKSAIFLEKKAEEYARKLAESEQLLKRFRGETKIVSFDEQRAILLKQQSDVNYARILADNEKNGLLQRLAELDKQLNIIPKTSQSSETALSYRLQPTEQKILDLRIREQDLLAKYKEDNLLVAGVREQLRLSEAFMENQRKIQPAQVVDPVWQDVYKQRLHCAADISAVNARIASLEGQLRGIDSEIQTFEALEQQNKSILREVNNNEEKYRHYRQRVEEAKIYDELNRQKMSSVSVIERASAPNIPVNLPKPLYVLIPGILATAILGSLALAYLLEWLSQGISTPTDAERRLGIPVLVSISVK